MPQIKTQWKCTDFHEHFLGIPAILNKPTSMSNVPGVVLVAMLGRPLFAFQKAIGPNGNHQPYFRRDINTLAVGLLLIQGELNIQLIISQFI